MPKVYLRFSLPEEQEEFERATAATDLAISLSQFKEFLRSAIKYMEREDLDLDTLEYVRDNFDEILEDYNINLERILS